MMHGHEKSDPAIVAVKPANKAETAMEQSTAVPTAAESVEPRAGTEGNADQQSTCRTQSRASVSQALERIRKVARERKKEKFTALFHHISVELLGDAFYELKQDAAPGVDRLTWEDYEVRPRAQSRGFARSGPTGSVSGAAEPAGLHTQAGRQATPARGCRFGGQDRPTGSGHAAECDLRGRLPRSSRMDSGRGAARMTRWMRSASGSTARR